MDKRQTNRRNQERSFQSRKVDDPRSFGSAMGVHNTTPYTYVSDGCYSTISEAEGPSRNAANSVRSRGQPQHTHRTNLNSRFDNTQYMNQIPPTRTSSAHRQNRKYQDSEFSGSAETYTNERGGGTHSTPRSSRGDARFTQNVGFRRDRDEGDLDNSNEQTLRRQNVSNIGQSSTLPSLRKIEDSNPTSGHEVSPNSLRREYLRDYKSRTALGTIFRDKIRDGAHTMNLDSGASRKLSGSVHTSPWREIDHLGMANDTTPQFIKLCEIPSPDDELYPLYGKRLNVVSTSRISYKVIHRGQEYFIPKHMGQEIYEAKNVYGSRPPSVRSSENGGEWCQVDLVVQAITSYSARQEDELSLEPGDIVVIRWIMPTYAIAKGYNMGQYGKIPFDIVKQIPEKLLRGCRAEALFDYYPSNPDEIPMKAGDSLIIYETRLEDPGWWRCLKGDHVGVFPAAYLQIFFDPNNQIDVDQIEIVSSCPISHESATDVSQNNLDEERIVSRNGTPAIPSASSDRGISRDVRNSADSLRGSNSCKMKLSDEGSVRNVKNKGSSGSDSLDAADSSEITMALNQSNHRNRNDSVNSYGQDLRMGTAEDIKAGLIDMATMMKSNHKYLLELATKFDTLNNKVTMLEDNFTNQINNIKSAIEKISKKIVGPRRNSSE